jgi:hypothetical protein
MAKLAVTYTNARAKIDTFQEFAVCAELAEADTQPDWDYGYENDLAALQLFDKPARDACYADCPPALARAASYTAWEKSLRSWIRTQRPLRLFKSARLQVVSEPGEAEREFRIRLQQIGNEQRDIKVASLRKAYEQKVARLEDQLMRAAQAVDREAEQASASKLDTALSVGTALLGALLGRKRVSVTSVSRAGTAARRASNMRKQSGDVKRAQERLAALEQETEDLKAEFDAEVAQLEDAFNAQNDELSDVLVRASSANIQIKWLGIAWSARFANSNGTA